MSHTQSDAIQTQSNRGAFASIAARFGFKDAAAAEHVLTATVMPTGGKVQPSREQIFALAVVADQYKLNPWTREIYAFPDTKTNGIVPIVGYNGWIKLATDHPQFNGSTFRYGPDVDFEGERTVWEGPYGNRSKKVEKVTLRVSEWIECVVYRKDHAHPTVKRRYFSECYRATDPWVNEPRHMHEVRTYCHAVRQGLGITGLFTPDEADLIREREAQYEVKESPRKPQTLDEVAAQLRGDEPEPNEEPANEPEAPDEPWPDPTADSGEGSPEDERKPESTFGDEPNPFDGWKD